MLDRRGFLKRSAFLGCSLAASPLVTPISLAATPGENRLVVIILRGGMDGLDVVQPYGDPDFARLRGAGKVPGAAGQSDLDGFFSLHPALHPLVPLWQGGDLGFVHAVSTPYRDKRSHFDGQDLLESGTTDMSGAAGRDGWLNRLLQHMPGAGSETAYAVGRDSMAVLRGPAPVARWSPEADLRLSPQAVRLARLVMQDDPAFAAALTRALDMADSDGDPVAVSGDTDAMMSMAGVEDRTSRTAGAGSGIAAFVARRLRDEARIAAFSITGWDTHEAQDRHLPRALKVLADTILTLRNDLGTGVWGRTAIVAMTEFGRTVRMNGTRGTDHGTGGLMLLAGGAVRGGVVHGDWPGLADADLYAGRDLTPTRDLRAQVGWILRGMFGSDRWLIEDVVFPGLSLGLDPRLLL